MTTGAPSRAVKTGHMVFVPDAIVRVQMLQAGEVDLVDTTPWDQVKPLEQAGFNVAILDAAPSISRAVPHQEPECSLGRRARARGHRSGDRQGSHAAGHLLRSPRPQRLAGGLGSRLQPRPEAHALRSGEGEAADGRRGIRQTASRCRSYYPAMGMEPKQAAEAVSLYLKELGITCEVQALEMGQADGIDAQVERAIPQLRSSSS